MKHCNHLIGLLAFLLFCSCSESKDISSRKVWHEKKVVVVLPQSDGMGQHWQRVMQLFSSNAESAFRQQDEGIRLSFEFHDELSENLDQLAEETASREDVYAVIGGLYSDNASRLAATLCRSGTTFFTLATTEELVRGYSATGNLWAMTETDITQSEVLLSKVVNYGGKTVALLVNGDDSYGKTFVDWFGFQATELGLESKGIYAYHRDDLPAVAEKAMSCGADFAICVPSAVDDIAAMTDAAKAVAGAPRLLFSDMGYGADVIARLGQKAEGIEGVCFGSDPEAGFDVSFRTFFGVGPTVGAAQVYDAAMLLAYAAWYQHIHPETTLQAALRTVVDGRDFNLGSWMGEDMRNVVNAMAQGGKPYVRGASGWLDFDSKVYTNVLATIYYNYKIYDGGYIILDYNTAPGVTASMMRRTLQQMADRRSYRKLCMFVETCFSGSVFSQCTGFPGMLFVTAADAGETSKADVFDADLCVWMTNRFTSTLTESLTENPSITLRELYTRLFINTVGSHVMVYNSDSYGSIYRNTMEEFIKN